MGRLVVKLPFKGKSGPPTGEKTSFAAASTKRSRKYRKKLKTDHALKQQCDELKV